MFQEGFNQSYKNYLVLRGFDPSANPLIILKRAIIDSWLEPGFHNFWRVWNPGIGHLLYRLYLLMGGNHIRLIAALLVFMFCGLIHDEIVMLIFRRPFCAFTVAFTLFGILALLNRSLESILNQKRWPRLLNAVINISFLAGSIYSAVQLQMYIFP